MVRATFIVLGLVVPLLAFGLMPTSASADISPQHKQRTLALADSLYAAGAADSSQIILAEAIPAARAGTDSLYLQDLIVRQGCQLAAFGHAVRSEPILNEALAMAESRGDSSTVCQVLRWLGYSVSNQGRWDEAEDITRRQVVLAEALDLMVMKGWAQVALGWYAEQRGQIEIAVRENTLAVEIFRSVSDSTGLTWSLNNLGNAQLDLGDRSQARKAYLEAAAIARRVDYVLVEAMAANNLGVMEFDGGDPAIALAQFQRANELQSRLEYTLERINSGLNIGLCLVYLGRLGEAAVQLEGIVVEAESLDQPEVVTQALLALASLRYREGRTESAKKILRRVIYDERDVSPNQRTEGMRSLAVLLANQDSVGTAIELLEQAAEQLKGQPNSVQALRVDNLWGELLVRDGHDREGLEHLLTVDVRAERIGLSGQRVPALAHAAKAYRRLDRPDSSLSLLERAAAVWEAERSIPSDPHWRELRGALGSRIYTDWAVQVVGQTSAEDPRREAFGRLQRFKGRTLLERMSGPGEIPNATTGFVSLGELQRILAEDELFLDAYLGPEASLLFAVTRRETRVWVWPGAAEFEDRIGLFHDLNQIPAAGETSAGESEALHEMGTGLGNFLLGGIVDMVRSNRRLIIAPDGILNMLPWSTLSLSDPASGAGVIPLSDQGVSIVPSATILVTLRGRAAEGHGEGPASVLAFCDESPTLDSSLPAARREIEWLRRNFEGVTCDPASADPVAPLAGWRGHDVLHFAAHIRSHDAAPWQSEIRLGGDPASAVRATTIAEADLTASLVVLAGCESAGGSILSGEGVQGLTSAFIGAGARSVLATLWPVEDRATFDLMQHFYRGLASGRPVGDALANAREELRTAPRTAHPFFWAGFVLVGDPDVKVTLAEKGSGDRWLAIPAIIVIPFVILAVRRRLS